MPIYEYRCKNGHTFEVMQSMSDPSVTKCEVCGAPVERVFHPIAIHFKGSGFYTTDYGRNRGAAGGDGSSASKDDSKSESSSDSKSDSKTDSKSDSKAAATKPAESSSSSKSDG